MKNKKTKSGVIVIGGSDPSGGAGIQADLSTLNSLKVPAFSVVTALTAQTEKKFASYEMVSAKNFNDQLKSLSLLAPQSIVKIGMLGSGSLIPPLVAWLKKNRPRFVILDPVLRSSTGYRLLDKEGIRLLPTLLPYVDLLSPNLPEAEALAGIKIKEVERMEEAGKKLLKKVRRAVLVKGGHLQGSKAVDLLITKSKPSRSQKGKISYFPLKKGDPVDFVTTFPQKRILGKGVHGSGCTLASALAGYLFLGKSLEYSVKGAKSVVLRKLLDARRIR
jgi:hydroxymethylpyrimidine/phosphomethylpyrimidine kinase